jgi:hypothetical protein
VITDDDMLTLIFSDRLPLRWWCFDVAPGALDIAVGVILGLDRNRDGNRNEALPLNVNLLLPSAVAPASRASLRRALATGWLDVNGNDLNGVGLRKRDDRWRRRRSRQFQRRRWRRLIDNGRWRRERLEDDRRWERLLDEYRRRRRRYVAGDAAMNVGDIWRRVLEVEALLAILLGGFNGRRISGRPGNIVVARQTHDCRMDISRIR